jgi:hypothetical protein
MAEVIRSHLFLFFFLWALDTPRSGTFLLSIWEGSSFVGEAARSSPFKGPLRPCLV